jgi:signal transduction histidine kinase
MGESLLSVPLLAQGRPFGVLVLLHERNIPDGEWDTRLAKGFADQAAIAISNARLYEEAMRQGKDLLKRLRHLENQAEMLAHDLKGPGERMEELADRLLIEYGGQMDERAVSWLRRMQTYGQDLGSRVEDILEVARLGAGSDAVEAVDPALIIDDILKARAGELEESNVTVEVANPLPVVAGHRAYLRQVFDNLISNAVKYSKDRPDPTIRIEASLKGDRAQFSVRDNGVGVPLRHRDRVFEPFVRLDTGSAKGSGIGLTIVKRIIELHDGQVWIEPEECNGCSVTFTLPVVYRPAGQYRPPERSE